MTDSVHHSFNDSISDYNDIWESNMYLEKNGLNIIPDSEIEKSVIHLLRK